MAVTERKTADQRREDVLDAALSVFAEHGLSGASTDEIARKAGISQPYLFRLFHTKKELFIASTERCFRETRETFDRAAEGKSGEEALKAMGDAYGELIRSNPNRLRGQMQAYVAAGDPEIRAVVRKGYGEIVDTVERVVDEWSDHPENNSALLDVDTVLSAETWARRRARAVLGLTGSETLVL
jgi:AcrR family transcriptional regulator